MRVACVQIESIPGEGENNLERARAGILRAAEQSADLILLPEMWDTGFYPKADLPQLCDAAERHLAELASAARHAGAWLAAGSTVTARSGLFYNTARVFDRKGREAARYDKAHLFSMSGEPAVFAKGDRLCTFGLEGMRCGLLLCYDIRFPEAARTLALEGARLLLLPAQWPNARLQVLKLLSAARAAENRMFTAVCNGAGNGLPDAPGGGSRVCGINGEVLCEADDGNAVIAADCDPAACEAAKQFPDVFADRRPELYRI